MKIPNSGKRKALIVVDVQPIFIKPHNKYIARNIATLIRKVPYDLYVEAVFHTEQGSLWDEQKNWIAPLNAETHTLKEITDVLKAHKPIKILKETRSAFKGDKNLRKLLQDNQIEEVHVVGTETNDCVLATAFDAFDLGFLPYVIEECCESATEGRHKMGAQLLRIEDMSNNHCSVKTINVQL